MNISVIIPTYNEEIRIAHLVKHLLKHKNSDLNEVLVIDGGSTDGTVNAARHAGAATFVSPKKGRAAQMNDGGSRAKGEILYFVHADVLPPVSYAQHISAAFREGFTIGCFRTRFESDKLMLKINGYFSRFDRLMCRGGDQTLFVTKALFDSLKGYDDYYVVMEEYDFIKRARKKAEFKIIPEEVSVSARKYDKNSYFKVNMANFIIFTMFRMGYPPITLRNTYHKLIDYPYSITDL